MLTCHRTEDLSLNAPGTNKLSNEDIVDSTHDESNESSVLDDPIICKSAKCPNTGPTLIIDDFIDDSVSYDKACVDVNPLVCSVLRPCLDCHSVADCADRV